jgi:hypothetical protein
MGGEKNAHVEVLVLQRGRAWAVEVQRGSWRRGTMVSDSAERAAVRALKRKKST